MKNLIRLTALLIFGTLIISASEKNGKSAQDLDGVWESGSGDVIFISQKDEFLDIQGKDEASLFQSTCVLGKGTAECFGHGVQLVENRRFLYKSTFKISSQDGQAIILENWEGKFSNGKTVAGQTRFQRQVKTNQTR